MRQPPFSECFITLNTDFNYIIFLFSAVEIGFETARFVEDVSGQVSASAPAPSPSQEPFFNDTVRTEVFAPVGGRSTIECRVGNLGESAVGEIFCSEVGKNKLSPSELTSINYSLFILSPTSLLYFER